MKFIFTILILSSIILNYSCDSSKGIYKEKPLGSGFDENGVKQHSKRQKNEKAWEEFSRKDNSNAINWQNKKNYEKKLYN